MAESILSSFSSVNVGDIIKWMKTGESFSLNTGSSSSTSKTASHSRNIDAIAFLMQYSVSRPSNEFSANGVLIIPNIVFSAGMFITMEVTLEITSTSISVGYVASGTTYAFNAFITEILE